MRFDQSTALIRTQQWTISLILFLLPFFSLAQIDLVPIERTPPAEKKGSAYGRIASTPLTAMKLPFWDDFSFNATSSSNFYYPNDTLWENSRTVWVNDVMGINPPSVYVATFDGYDSLGKPYSSVILTRGFADQMTSRGLRTDLIEATQRPSTFISFFYQFQGNGEASDRGDVLNLYFKDKDGIWSLVWQIENRDDLDPNQFVPVQVAITDDRYFHGNFQFRFQNFGRLSGAYDTWNIDYVYVSNGNHNLASNPFPDRTISRNLSPIFGAYSSIPYKHLKTSPSEIVSSSFDLYNLRTGNIQPINFSSFLTRVSYYHKKVDNTFVPTFIDSTTHQLDDAVDAGSVSSLEHKTVSLVNKPSISGADPLTDSIIFKLKVSINTKDNLTPANNGDYLAAIFSPVDFRRNDTIRYNFYASSYYAYDDGVAEYGAKINGLGTQLAYEFDMKTTATDTIVAIDTYFPKFGDESSQSIQLHVLSGLSGNESDYLVRHAMQIKRTSRDSLKRVFLSTPAVVKGKFYVGWKLLTSSIIPIGLDRNNDSGSKLYVNTTGTWVQNTDLKGSLMIRPVFIRKGEPPPNTAVPDENFAKLYPNPSSGTFFLPKDAQNIFVYDATGKPVGFAREETYENQQVTLISPSAGIYIVRYYLEKWHTEKAVIWP